MLGRFKLLTSEAWRSLGANLSTTFAAERGKGAYLNDQRIHVSKVTRLSESLMGTGFPSHKRHKNPNIYFYHQITLRTHGVRRAGGVAIWGIAFVASLLGAALSYVKDWPMGATIVCLFGVTVALVSLSVRMRYVDDKVNGAPLAADSLGAGPSRLLQDNTALARGNRTRVRYLEPARPAYPKRAREMGWEGTVLLRVEVRTDGTVAEVKVEQTSGYTMLDQSAVVTARGWRFAPEMDGGFTMPTIVDVPVRFDLTEYAADELSK